MALFQSIWKKLKNNFKATEITYYATSRPRREPQGGMRNEEQFRKPSRMREVLSGRVRHLPSGRRGTILHCCCLGTRLVDDVETNPYEQFYEVRWDDGTLEREVPERNLRNELSAR